MILDQQNYLVNHIEIKQYQLLQNQGTAGAYLFAGPKGVGKTLTAQLLTKELFGNEQFMHTLNCKLYNRPIELRTLSVNYFNCA